MPIRGVMSITPSTSSLRTNGSLIAYYYNVDARTIVLEFQKTAENAEIIGASTLHDPKSVQRYVTVSIKQRECGIKISNSRHSIVI